MQVNTILSGNIQVMLQWEKKLSLHAFGKKATRKENPHEKPYNILKFHFWVQSLFLVVILLLLLFLKEFFSYFYKPEIKRFLDLS